MTRKRLTKAGDGVFIAQSDGFIIEPQRYVLRASASSTGGGGTGSDVTMSGATWASFYLDVSDITANTLSAFVQVKDETAGRYFDVLTFSAASAASSERLPYVVNSNIAPLPDETVRVTWSQGGTASITWGASAYGKP